MCTCGVDDTKLYWDSQGKACVASAVSGGSGGTGPSVAPGTLSHGADCTLTNGKLPISRIPYTIQVPIPTESDNCMVLFP